MTFDFDRKRTIAVIACTLVLCALAFLAGMVTGIGLWAPSREEIALLRKSHQTEVPALSVPAVKLPALSTVHAQSPTPVQEPIAAPPAAPAPAPVAASAPPQPPEAPAPPSAEDAKADVFSVQFGCFLDVKNAKQLQADLKELGYATTIVTSLDPDQREWHVVRQPGYKSLSSANQAASAFNNKEHLPVLVRRSNTL